MAQLVNDQDFEKEVLKSELPVMVDFFAEWCGPCKALLPIVEDLAEEKKAAIKVVKVNVDQSPALAEKFGIRSIPTLVFMKGGQVKEVQVGALTRDSLEEKLDSLVAAK